MKLRTALVLGATMLPIATAQAATPAALDAAFATPPTAARPMLRWWWPGGDVTTQGIDAELAAAIDAGFGGFEIQPFRAGLTAATGDEAARIDSYGSPQFFRHVGDAARFAAAHGAALDYTLGSGWPTGGSGVSPEHAALELRSAAMTLTGPAQFHGRIAMPAPHPASFVDRIMPPPAGQAVSADDLRRLAARTRIVAVLAVRGDAPRLVARPQSPGSFFPQPDDVAQSGVLQPGTTIDLTAHVAPDGTLDWQAPAGTWQVITFVQQAEGRKVALAAGSGPQLVLNHLDADAFAAYAAWHAAGLEPLVGPGVRSVFVDSFELTPDNPWSADFLTQFRVRRGYDLTPYLPLILLPQWMGPYAPEASHPLYTMGELGPRIREDYHRTASELFQQRFLIPLRDWCHAHGFSLRLQAHGAQADLIGSYGLADIPETEDLFAGPSTDFFALARSAADIYGKPFASAESMIIVGHALDTTPAMYKRRADQLFAGGIAQLVEHGMPYVAGPTPGIGWAPFGSIFGNELDPANPLFALLRPLNDYDARMGTILRATKPVVPVVIYQDMLFQHAVIDLSHPPADALRTALHAAGYGADTMTLDGLLKSRVANGRIVTPGGLQYSALVIADQPALDPRGADMLAHAAAQGLRILFIGRRPDRAPGLVAAPVDAAVRAAIARFGASSMQPVQASDIGKALQAAGVAPSLHFTTAVPDYAERTDGSRRFIFLANPGPLPTPVSFTVPYRGAVQEWYPWTGRIAPGRATPDGSGLRLTTTLQASGSALLSIDPAAPFVPSPPPPPPPVAVRAIAPSAWRITATGFNAAAQAVDTAFSLAQLRDWRSIPQLGNFSGHVGYTTRFTASPPAHARSLLDFGDVHDALRVTLNGCTAGRVVAPWLVDVTDAIRPGANDLTATVANMPQNGMAGRRLDPRTPPIGGTDPAGLLGPVRLLRAAAADPDVPALVCTTPPGAGRRH